MLSVLRVTRYSVVLATAALSWASWAADDGAIVANQPDIKWAACGNDPPWNVCQRHVIHGDPAKEVSESMLRFPKGFAFPKHWHDNAEQVVMTAGSMVISFEGGRKETLRAGGFMYIPPKLAHWGSCPDGCTFYLGIVGPDSYYE